MTLLAYKQSHCSFDLSNPCKRDEGHTKFIKTLKRLNRHEKQRLIKIIQVDYDELQSATIIWINLQNTPKAITL